MDDTFGGDFNSTRTTVVGAAAASNQKTEGIATVFIKHVLLSAESNIKMWEMTLGMVACVAIVRSIDTSSTKITYLLEDHTGRIDAHLWLEEGDKLKVPNIMINNYVKVYGTVRSQGGNKTIMIFKILSVNDPNEICTHILETLNMRYKSEKFASSYAGGSSDFPMTNAMDNNLGLEGKHLAVFQVIKSDTVPGGISREQLRKKFSHISKNELDDILDFMISEGHIYSSCDADHFVSTE